MEIYQSQIEYVDKKSEERRRNNDLNSDIPWLILLGILAACAAGSGAGANYATLGQRYTPLAHKEPVLDLTLKSGVYQYIPTPGMYTPFAA